MVFTTDKLEYKAISYSSYKDPLTLKTQTLKLVKQSDGTYNVPENNILVKVHSASLNPVDLMLYRFAFPLFSRFNPNQGIGKDYCGTVVAIGDKASKKTDFKAGDQVCGLYLHAFGKGTVSEYVLLDALSVEDSEVALIPTNLNLNEAAAWPLVYGTAYDMLDGRIRENAKVLVLGGATAVGRFAIQLCKYFKAKEIVATCSSRSAPFVTELGATRTIDYTKCDSLLNPVVETTTDGKYDLILDCVGNRDFFGSMSKVLKPKSEKSAYVTIVGDKKFDYSFPSLSPLMIPQLKASFRSFANKLGLLSFDYQKMFLTPQGKKWIEHGKKLIENGDVKVFIDSVYKLDSFDEAVKRLKSNKASGKIIVQIEED